MNNNMKWCVQILLFRKKEIIECISKEEALNIANRGKPDVLEDGSVVRYFMALLKKTKDGYEDDPKHPTALNFMRW